MKKNIEWLGTKIVIPDEEIADAARVYQRKLTKPAGSLGMLEDIAVRFCSMQGTLRPNIEKTSIVVFAADHGVVAERVSAFPQEVTVEMLSNFVAGGAAICVMAETLNADFFVVNMGTASKGPQDEKIIQRSVGEGTHNFCLTTAMSELELADALNVGSTVVERLEKDNCALFIGGEMGIGNTTSAAALACALISVRPEEMVGLGTGISETGRQRKIAAVTKGLDKHSEKLSDPLSILQALGGFEIVALAAAYLRCAQLEIPSLIDGYICSVAALFAARINPDCLHWFFYSHESAETGHQLILAALGAKPLINLQMRLGEASGAALVLPLLRTACDLHNKMAKFDEAGVSNKS